MTTNNPVSFSDTSTAFSSKSNYRLFKMYLLFAAMNYNKLVKIGNNLISFLFRINFPIKGLIKFTVFEHFCGGETIAESEATIAELSAFGIGTILDYSVEGEKNERGFDKTAEEIIRTIEKSAKTKHIPFSVFKVTGVASSDLLTKIQIGKEPLTEKEQEAFSQVKSRVEKICNAAFVHETRLLVDAEETWIQDIIDEMVYDMMLKYNQIRPVIYNTYQLYRHDMLENLKEAHAQMRKHNCKLGAKLVRGAYMEKERDRADELGYPSPINPDKKATDKLFNEALKYCVENLNDIGLCSGTHNEYSNEYLVSLMERNQITPDHENIYFAQLYGMSDNISFNLAKNNYQVVKYVPYGPVKSVLPYLFRRSQENSSVAGQSSREFTYIKKEIKRRLGL